MNWLLIIVILVLAGNIVWGFSKGFLRVIYSMLAWIAILVFVTWATPYVANVLTEKTNIDNRIETNLDEKLHELVIGDTNGQKEDREPDTQNPGQGKKNYRDLQMKLPDAVTNKLFDTNKIADQILEGSGAYDVVAGRATDLVMRVISFVLVLLIAVISFHLLSVVLKVVEKLPLIGGINRLLGLFAGLVKGILIIWLAFAIIAMAGTTDIGIALISYIYESPLLIWAYENNFVLTLLMTFL
ncbi:MAG: CvpA family protein [Lachnobacterium sp.]|nr:CvpA family protein [Lachnobacterium sp.]